MTSRARHTITQNLCRRDAYLVLTYYEDLDSGSSIMAFASKASAQGLTILTASDISTLLATLDPELVLDSQRNAFLALNTQSDIPSGGIPPVQCPQRIVLKSGQTNNLFMPSRVADAGGTACKIVSVPMNGGEGGLPATTVVMDESTGKVKAVINARRLTALRNAAGMSPPLNV